MACTHINEELGLGVGWGMAEVLLAAGLPAAAKPLGQVLVRCGRLLRKEKIRTLSTCRRRYPLACGTLARDEEHALQMTLQGVSAAMMLPVALGGCSSSVLAPG